jgi:16S rRNA processing protein RimM
MGPEGKSLLCVGHVLGAQGIQGWVRIYSNTSPRENIIGYRPWLIERNDELEPVEFKGKRQGKHVLAKLEGIEDRNQAEALTGCRLFIRQAQLPELEADEYYWSDLIGLQVETIDAEPLGEIVSMLETGADDVMVLRGERERLIPFVMDDIVTEVDLENRRIVVNWSPEY